MTTHRHSDPPEPRRVWREIDPDDWTVTGIGRIYRHQHGPQKGQWFWSMTAHVGHDRTRTPCEGVAEDLDAARAAVRLAWERTRTGRG